jgi:enoyl-CoA hydratase/carnithine racemase
VTVEHAEFWVPEVELGTAFTGGPALVMAARLGPWRAKEAMILCRHFTARELYALGMALSTYNGQRTTHPAKWKG